MKSSVFFRATLDLHQIFPLTDLCLTPGEENAAVVKLIHPRLENLSIWLGVCVLHLMPDTICVVRKHSLNCVLSWGTTNVMINRHLTTGQQQGAGIRAQLHSASLPG